MFIWCLFYSLCLGYVWIFPVWIGYDTGGIKLQMGTWGRLHFSKMAANNLSYHVLSDTMTLTPIERWGLYSIPLYLGRFMMRGRSGIMRLLKTKSEKTMQFLPCHSLLKSCPIMFKIWLPWGSPSHILRPLEGGVAISSSWGPRWQLSTSRYMSGDTSRWFQPSSAESFSESVFLQIPLPATFESSQLSSQTSWSRDQQFLLSACQIPEPHNPEWLVMQQ